MTDRQYQNFIKQRIADGLPHPFNHHPLNQLLDSLKSIKESISYYQEPALFSTPLM